MVFPIAATPPSPDVASIASVEQIQQNAPGQAGLQDHVFNYWRTMGSAQRIRYQRALAEALPSMSLEQQIDFLDHYCLPVRLPGSDKTAYLPIDDSFKDLLGIRPHLPSFSLDDTIDVVADTLSERGYSAGPPLSFWVTDTTSGDSSLAAPQLLYWQNWPGHEDLPFGNPPYLGFAVHTQGAPGVDQTIINGMRQQNYQVFMIDPEAELQPQVDYVLSDLGWQLSANPSMLPALPSEYALRAYPNPFNSTTTLNLTLPEAGAVDLRVYDGTGREIRRMPLGMLQAGSHTSSINLGGRASGMAYVTVYHKNEPVATQRLVLVK